MDVIRAVINSVLHTSVALAAATFIDPFFAFNPQEGLPESLLWLGAHTVTNGLAMSLVNKMAFPTESSQLSDPTGGAFLAFTFFIVQPSYIKRIRRIGDQEHSLIGKLIKDQIGMKINYMNETVNNNTKG